MVDAPPFEFPVICWNVALINLGISIPLCVKNLESSVAIIAFINTSGISLYDIIFLFSTPIFVITSLFLSRIVVGSLLYRILVSNSGAVFAI